MERKSLWRVLAYHALNQKTRRKVNRKVVSGGELISDRISSIKFWCLLSLLFYQHSVGYDKATIGIV